MELRNGVLHQSQDSFNFTETTSYAMVGETEFPIEKQRHLIS